MKHTKSVVIALATVFISFGCFLHAAEQCLTLHYSDCQGSTGQWLWEGCNSMPPGSWYVTGIVYTPWPFTLTDATGGGFYQNEFPTEHMKVTCWTARDVRLYQSEDCTGPYIDLGATSGATENPVTIFSWPNKEWSCSG